MDLKSLKPKARFSNRVENYLKYRPGYPDEIIAYLGKNTTLHKNCVIADIGSGTGKLSELFIRHGYQVHAVEPNSKMRHAAEKFFKNNKKYISLNGSAEAIPLADNSVDMIVVGQAFHWFETESAVKEFRRILNKNGFIILIWNNRDIIAHGLMRDYERLLQQYGNDYKQIRSIYYGTRGMKRLFKSEDVERVVFDYKQVFDFPGLKGRLESSSYCPLPGTDTYNNMIIKLGEIFNKHAEDNKVKITYKTEIYIIH